MRRTPHFPLETQGEREGRKSKPPVKPKIA